MASKMPAAWYRARAREEWHVEGEVEVDDLALVSTNDTVDGDEGAYVQAWVWVADPPEDEED